MPDFIKKIMKIDMTDYWFSNLKDEEIEIEYNRTKEALKDDEEYKDFHIKDENLIIQEIRKRKIVKLYNSIK